MNRSIKALCFFVCLCMILHVASAFSSVSASNTSTSTFSNSDRVAKGDSWYYASDVSETAHVYRHKLHTEYFTEDCCSVWDDSEEITDYDVDQMLFYNGMLYLSVGNLIRICDPDAGIDEVFFKTENTITRFAMTRNTLYFLTDAKLFEYDLTSKQINPVLQETAVQHFWLEDANTLSYMLDESLIYQLNISSGSITAIQNNASSIGNPIVKTSDTRGASLTSLRDKFPNGKYWNHKGMSGNNADGYTGSACSCHWREKDSDGVWHTYHTNTNCSCNSFSGIQCFGYANKIGYDCYGSVPSNSWTKLYNLNSLKAGDVIRYHSNGHSIFVTSVSGDMISFTDCNWTTSNWCVIRWDGSISKSSILNDGFSYVLSAPSTPAGIPQNVCAVQKDAYVVGVSWDAAANATSYDVYLIQSPYGWDDVKYSTSVSADYTYTELNGVAAGDYAVFVIARPNADTAQSSWVSVTVNNDAPSAPTISASDEWVKTSEVLTISWNAVAGASGYEYYMSEYPYAFAYEKYTYSDTVTGTSVSFNASSLPNGSYCFFMHAKNAAGSSPQSNWLYFDVYNGDYTPTKVEMYNGHIYALYEQDLSWTFAERMCENAGGHLVTITSQAENNFICNLIQSGSKDAYWIGARSDRSGSWYNSDNPFEWVTGEALGYTSWYPGEPSGSGTGGDIEHFAEIRKSYNNQWNDKPNYRTADDGFILEIDATSWQPTATATYGSSKYLLFDAGVAWSEARAYCDANGGHLATISSAAEDAAITNLLKQGTLAWFYLGGRSVGGTWKWMDNTAIPLSGSYSNWSDSTGAAQTGPTGWGDYLMKYKSTGTWIGMPNYDNPVDHLKHLGFVMEIDNAVNTVTFNPNGGSVSPTSKQIVYGDPYGELPTPTYGSNTFEGWFTAVSGGEKVTAATIVNVKANQTLYAHWIDGCADGHDYSYAVSIEPTITATGLLTGTCSKCGGSTTVVLPKLSTADYTCTTIQAATCTVEGLNRYTWKTTTYGNYVFDVVVAKVPHSYVAVITAPTCTEQGFTTYTCSACNDTYTDVYTAALGHNFVNGICTRCGAEDPDYVVEVKLTISGSPVTTAPGSTITVPVMVSGGANFAGFTLTVNSSEGLTLTKIEKGALLKNADGMFTPNVAQKMVNWTSSTDTAGEGELLVLTFTVGDAIVDGSVLNIALGLKDNKISNFADANETPVGVKFEPITVTIQTVLFGDVNSDGEVDTIDAIRLAKYLVDLVELTPAQIKAADVTGDNDVTATDAIRLAKYLVGLVDILRSPMRGAAHTDKVAIVTAGTANGKKGELITVPITVTNNPGLAGFTFEVNSPESLELVEVSAGALLKTAEGVLTCNTEKRLVNWISTDELTADGELLYLTFRVLENVDDAQITIAVKDGKDGNFADGDGRTILLNPFRDMPRSDNWAYDSINWAYRSKITNGTTATTFSPNADCTRAQVVTFLWRMAGEPEPTEGKNPFEDVPENAYYYKAVLWAAEAGVTAGTSATTFSPDTTCTRGQIVTFIWRYEGQPEATSTVNPFTDIKIGAYYEKAVLWASETGITAGTSATTFSPESTCTRAQALTLLFRTAKEV